MFVREDAISDGTHMPPSQLFAKTWVLGNPNVKDSCTWTKQYNAVWIGGPLLANMPEY